MQKLVLFGAGKIGRSFIGQLFSRSGYEVVFIDIFEPVVNALNQRKSYKVVIKAEKEEIIPVNNVRGVLGSETDKVIEEVATADILAVSVGQRGLPHILPNIAKGLLKRYENNPQKALDIIIAENMRNASEHFYNEILKNTGNNYPINQLVGLVETSIGKMVPIMTKKDMEKDILQVFAEPYNSLILDKKGFKNPIPDVEGLAPKENMKAWVDRKLFIHNLGHAATAYFGFRNNPTLTYIFEVLDDKDIKKFIKDTMRQAAEVLLLMYPDEFTMQMLEDHIDDLLARFQNKALGDTIFRVGCDLYRKLGKEDRLAAAVFKAIEYNKPYSKILYALMTGFVFRAKDENENMFPKDAEFAEELSQKGLDYMLAKVCGFDKEKYPKIVKEANKCFEVLIK